MCVRARVCVRVGSRVVGGESRHNTSTSIEVNSKQADFQFVLRPFSAVILPLWGERSDHMCPIGLFNKKNTLTQ